MDQSQNHQLHQPVPLQSSTSTASNDATPQDVLAEARKNLQVLIDSGIPKDLLHQLVDDSLSLQLLSQSSNQSPVVPSQQHQHQQQQQQQQQQSPPILAPQHAPPPPPPQCPPPPPPTAVPSTSQTPTPPMTSNSSTPSADIKTESIPEDMSQNWPSSTLPSNAAPMMTGMERHPSQMSSVDASIFLPPSAPFAHRPRISISSVSSGSSGHASIWSTNSAQSSFSWHSSASGRSMAPLPMPPSNTGGLPIINGTHVPSAASNANKQNIYWCTSCETSFKRKYDWKRHEDEFHERWRKYPCPEPGCNRSFWGSNSFNQHHKQCHGCKTCPHADKVVKFLRKRKYWACGFCSALHPARERHVEHVARHFESGLTKGEWMHSRVVYGLLHQPLIHEAWENLVTSKQSDYSGRRPQFSWHPSKTGRAQGFLEKENPGQLQDLLEFFSGDDSEASWIASVAYSLADIVMTPVATPSPQFANAQGAMGPPPPQHPTFATLPSQAHQQPPMLSPASPNNGNAFASSFRGPMFVPSQSFAPPSRPSPDSSSQSPMTASQSPLGQGQSPLDKREMQPQQHAQHSGPSNNESMMDFEYSPAPGGFDDWQSMSAPVAGTVASHQHIPSGGQGDWGMLQYFSDPRVTTS